MFNKFTFLIIFGFMLSQMHLRAVLHAYKLYIDVHVQNVRCIVCAEFICKAKRNISEFFLKIICHLKCWYFVHCH